MAIDFDTANDNTPLDRPSTGADSAIESGNADMRPSRPQRTRCAHPSSGLISVSRYSPVKVGVHLQHTPIPAPVSTDDNPRRARHSQAVKTGRLPVFSMLLLWFLLLAVIVRFGGGQTDNLLQGKSLAYVGGAWGLLSLNLAFVAGRRRAKISYSLGIAGAGATVVGLCWYYMQIATGTPSLEVLIIGFSAINMVLSKLWRAPVFLHISLLLTIGWSAYAFLQPNVSALAWMFPAIWSMQMFLALEFRYGRTIALSLLAGLVWIGVNVFILI